MKKEYLIDLIHRVRALTGIREPLIVGSQSLYAVTENVPAIVKDSIECDFLLATESIEARRMVNKELGILSDFSRANGYFADGLGLATVVLVPEWEARLQPLKDEQGDVLAHCLEPHDAAVSKMMAGREKDFPFIQALLAQQLISVATLIDRAALIQETASAGALLPRLKKLYDHLRHQFSAVELQPLTDLIRALETQK